MITTGRWSDYVDSYQRHKKCSVTILSKLAFELFSMWKYELMMSIYRYAISFLYICSFVSSILGNIPKYRKAGHNKAMVHNKFLNGGEQIHGGKFSANTEILQLS